MAWSAPRPDRWPATGPVRPSARARHISAREQSPRSGGLAASPGAAVGKLVFDPDTAEQWANNGEPVILARRETSPEDFHGMARAAGILTSRGGMTSHAAVVARQMGKPCVA